MLLTSVTSHKSRRRATTTPGLMDHPGHMQAASGGQPHLTAILFGFIAYILLWDAKRTTLANRYSRNIGSRRFAPLTLRRTDRRSAALALPLSLELPPPPFALTSGDWRHGGAQRPLLPLSFFFSWLTSSVACLVVRSDEPDVASVYRGALLPYGL